MRTGMLPIIKLVNEKISDERRGPPDDVTLWLLEMARGYLVAARARMQERDVRAFPATGIGGRDQRGICSG